MRARPKQQRRTVFPYSDTAAGARGRQPRENDVVEEFLKYPDDYADILRDEADRRGLRFPRGLAPMIDEIVKYIRGTMRPTVTRGRCY